jgi:hypothetical protein
MRCAIATFVGCGWGRLASSATFEMSAVAQGWLVYQLTGSAFALGWVGAG